MVNYISQNSKLANSDKFKAQLAKLKAGRSDAEYGAYIKSKMPPTTPSRAELQRLNYWGSDDDRLAIEEIEGSADWAAKDLAFKRLHPKIWDYDGNRIFAPDSVDQAAQQALLAKRAGGVSPMPNPTTKVNSIYGISSGAIDAAPRASSETNVMAPPPGMRNMLFAQKKRPQHMNRNSFYSTAFGAPQTGANSQMGLTSQPQSNVLSRPVYAGGNDYFSNMSNTMQPVAMPQSNLARYAAIQNGAARTPYSHLVDQRAAEIQKIIAGTQGSRPIQNRAAYQNRRR